MPKIEFLPISRVQPELISPLMAEEERAWKEELAWDYSPILKILKIFMDQKLLPGYVAVQEQRAIAYAYFLVNRSKAVIGAVFASPSAEAASAADRLIDLVFSGIRSETRARRVEAQIMPFHGIRLRESFTRLGFTSYPRHYLELDLSRYSPPSSGRSGERTTYWDAVYLPFAAELILASYRGQSDALLCEDYWTRDGCEGYLRSLLENPGCGFFVPHGSFLTLDDRGLPSGFLISSRIADRAAMIPQIAIHPSQQGKGLGDTLMHKTLSHFKSQGYRSMSLTVTEQNTKAFEWYQRLGFGRRKQFYAYVWTQT